MARNVDIDTVKVRSTGDDMDALSRSTTKRLSHALDSSQDLPYSASGWSSAQALRSCATAWEDHMVALANKMNDLSHNLHDSANSYDAADAEAESRLRSGLTELGQA